MRTLHRPVRAMPVALAIAGMLLASQAAVAEATVSSSFSGGILTVRRGKPADRVAVGCSNLGLVQVSRRDPSFGQLSCSVVSEVDARMGGGNDRVNLSGVATEFGARDFPGFGHGTGAAAQLGPGNDRYIGSP